MCSIRVTERRRKRRVIPILYCLAELILIWLVLVLIELEFNILNWDLWAIVTYLIFAIYSVAKTVRIYERQKTYLTQKEYKKLKELKE